MKKSKTIMGEGEEHVMGFEIGKVEARLHWGG